MSCACGGACQMPVPTNVLARWDSWDRCAYLAHENDRKLCRLSAALKENTMTTHRLQDDPDPARDDEDLAELAPHVAKYAKVDQANVWAKLKRGHKALTGTGLSARAATSAMLGLVQADWARTQGSSVIPPKSRGQGSGSAMSLSDPSGVQGRDLPPEVVSMIARWNAKKGGLGTSLGPKFWESYDRLDGTMSRERALRLAILETEADAERLWVSLGPRDNGRDPLDQLRPEDAHYLAENQGLTDDVAARLRTGKTYDIALREASEAHPQAAERVALGYRHDVLAPTAATFTARDTMTKKIEDLMAAEPTLAWQAAYDRVAGQDPQLHERTVAEMSL